MRQHLRRLQKTRRYEDTFKRHLVEEFESGRFSVGELSRLHHVPGQTIYRWIYKFSTLMNPVTGL